MTTGAPLFLVSACGSAEEFVAAFRRYADRAGLFVPIADPLPQGRRGRIAITLSDGRIVLEGEVEVATASARPSPLYGRIGMTLKFVDADAATRTTLTELEKARLAMKPPPLSIAPRAPSEDVPSQPRPTPPPVGGRIDVSNALAETVAIGDIAAWRDAANATPNATPKATIDSPSSKFVIPTIPQVGAPRLRTPSVPPALQPKIATEPKPPPLPGTTPVVIPPKQVTPQPIPVIGRATTMGMPAVGRGPSEAVRAVGKPTTMGVPAVGRGPSEAIPVVGTPTTMGMPAVGRAATEAIPIVGKPTTMGMVPIRDPGVELESERDTSMDMAPIRMPSEVVPSEVVPSEAVAPRRDPTPIPKRGEAIVIPKRELAGGKQTTLGMPIVRLPAEAERDNGPSTIESPAPPPPMSTTVRRAHTPSTSPAPRQPTPYTPLPIVRPPARETLSQNVDLSETTERTTIPEPPPVGEDQKKTSLGISMMSASPVETGWDESGPYTGPPPVEPPGRSGGLRASEIMAAMKGEDWVMAPDASQPTIVPKPASDIDTKAADEKSGPEPGDWAISLDPQAPGGWTAPAKVEKLPESKQHPASGNRNIAIASAQAIEAVEWADKPTGIGEALVEIDPSLMDPTPARATSVVEDEPINIVSTPIADVLPPPSQPFSLTGSPLIAKHPTPPPLLSATLPPPVPSRPAASASFPSFEAQVHDAGLDFAQDPTDAITGRKRRRTLVLVVATAVLAIVTLAVILFAGSKHAPEHAANGSGSAIAVAAADAAVQVIEVAPKGSAQEIVPPPAIDAGVAAPQICSVDITTSPTGAEISTDAGVLGTSPATVVLPCGVATKVTVKKPRFGTAVKAFTATGESSKLAIRIAAPQFQLKVTSLPSGATITIGGKVVGITPTSIKVVAGAPTMITLSKDGFAPDTQKIATRTNNAAHHVVLKHLTKKLH